MTLVDYLVLILYLIGMIVIGLLAMHKTRTQSDYFMGGRSFGKWLQTFAAFGAGTGAHEPVAVGQTVWTSGLSGVWSAMMWLFITPIYWITALWYRRMRHLTLGDWFSERYDSPALGAAFTVYALIFYMAFLSTMLTAITAFAVPLLGVEKWWGLPVQQVLIPMLAVTVIGYGVVGGLTAAYWTDLVQGVLIILLSFLLIPFGLQALVSKYGDPAQQSLYDGFAIMHQRISADYFNLFTGPSSGEFPPLYIASITLLALVGIVVHPHFIATGGGSAKTENEARIGLVAGNFLKRICTVGWAITGLIALALLGDNSEIAMDVSRVWGVASREILGPLGIGLVGLMFACLLAAMMSSADAYMLVTSALMVRNVYAPYINPNASERTYVIVGRLTGMILVVGASILSLWNTNVFEQFKFAVEIPIVLAAPFWLGLFWRRTNATAVWLTMAFSVLAFFVLPSLLPALWPELRTDPRFAIATERIVTTTQRPASAADIARHEAWLVGQQRIGSETDPDRRAALQKKLGPEPPLAPLGEPLQVVTRRGGQGIFWQAGVELVPDSTGEWETVAVSDENGSRTERQVYRGPQRGKGTFQYEFVLYQRLGLDLSKLDRATIEALRLPTRLVLPFLVLMGLSCLTPRTRREVLDKYYVKMKTEVCRDADSDLRELELSYAQPNRFDHKKLFPGSDWEFLKPRSSDVVGFLACLLICGAIIGLLVWLASIGA